MKATYIDYKDTDSFSKTLLAYLANAPALAPFAGNRPDMEGFARQIEAKADKTDRGPLVQVLRRQYGNRLAEQSAVAANISALADERPFTEIGRTACREKVGQ